MAALYPDIEGVHALSLGQAREFEVVRLLARELSDDFAVFHGVMWSGLEAGRQRFGEIDVIVLTPAGDMALLEVKSGSVSFTRDGVRKQYASGVKDVSMQLRFQYGGLRQRLGEEGLTPGLAQFLVLPDMRVGAGVVAYPRERIIDRDDLLRIGRRIREALPDGALNRERFRAARRFLGNVFAVEADPTARVDWLTRSVMALSEGLATWAPRVRAPGGVSVIRATAGAGKTQLALRLFEDAQAAGQRVRYVCFNRPLADHLRRHVEAPSGSIVTFHELAIERLRAAGDAVLDFNGQDVFARAEVAFCAHPGERQGFDVLVIDEAQDFSGAWIDALMDQRKPSGRAYVLMDESQALYRREGGSLSAASLEAAVEIHCWDNFRSPRRIVQVINAFGLTPSPVLARGPFDGDLPGFHRYSPDDDPAGMSTLEGVLRQLSAESVPDEHIVLLSYAGRGRSALLAQQSLLGRPLRRFTGGYDARGRPVWSAGQLLAESVHRFKGQAAPVVVLCEVDFDRLDESVRHRLFVGMTRAQLRLEIVLSERAESALMGSLATSGTSAA